MIDICCRFQYFFIKPLEVGMSGASRHLDFCYYYCEIFFELYAFIILISTIIFELYDVAIPVLTSALVLGINCSVDNSSSSSDTCIFLLQLSNKQVLTARTIFS